MNPGIWLSSRHSLALLWPSGPLPPRVLDVTGEMAAPLGSAQSTWLAWEGSDPARCRGSSGSSWFLSPMQSSSPLVPETPWICGEWLWKLIKTIPFIGVSGLLLFGSACGAWEPGLCYKSYCMSGASQNPAPIILCCWKPPERKIWGRGEEKEGEFQLHFLNPISQAFISWLRLCIWNSPSGCWNNRPILGFVFLPCKNGATRQSSSSLTNTEVDPPAERTASHAWILQEDLVFVTEEVESL